MVYMGVGMKILAIVGLSILSAALYRAGGYGRPFRSWNRDWLCPACAIGILWVLKGFHGAYWWQYLLFYGLSGASLSTYWTPKKQENVGAINWALSGMGMGLATLPLLWADCSLWGLLARIVVLILGITAVSVKFDNVWWEEGSRGFLFAVSMVLLLI
jgi:hypothetical protein